LAIQSGLVLSATKLRDEAWRVSRANTVARGSGRQSQSGRRLSFNMMPYGGHWGAPSVMAAFAGFVHDRESTANDERHAQSKVFS
jgi:hypothetical protein